MPLAGFEPTIPVFKRAMTFHALDPAATVTGSMNIYKELDSKKLQCLIN
jgi:shikimate 5-dehydrogenase